MGAAFKIMGTTGDVTSCDCCHRRGLRKTVALMPLDADGGTDGEVTYYGTGCAATAMAMSSYRVRRAARNADIQATIERRAALRDRAAWALPRLEDFRANLVRRMEAGEDPATVAKGHAARLGTAVWRYAPESRDAVEAEARAAFTAGGLAAVLALYDQHVTEAGRVARMDPAVFTY